MLSVYLWLLFVVKLRETRNSFFRVNMCCDQFIRSNYESTDSPIFLSWKRKQISYWSVLRSRKKIMTNIAEKIGENRICRFLVWSDDLGFQQVTWLKCEVTAQRSVLSADLTISGNRTLWRKWLMKCSFWSFPPWQFTIKPWFWAPKRRLQSSLRL